MKLKPWKPWAPAERYVPAYKTDIRVRFRAVRKGGEPSPAAPVDEVPLILRQNLI